MLLPEVFAAHGTFSECVFNDSTQRKSTLNAWTADATLSPHLALPRFPVFRTLLLVFLCFFFYLTGNVLLFKKT